MAAKPLILRCKTKCGQHIIENLTPENTVEDLKACLFSITGIEPSSMKVLAGYPPRHLNLSNGNEKVDSLCLQQRETLIVEESPTQKTPTSITRFTDMSANIYEISGDAVPNSGVTVPGILMKRVVPANNSCLFTSVHFALSGGVYNPASGSSLRQIIADTVASDKVLYNEAFLGKPNREYCTWILNEDHWGGAIELSILSKHFGLEIVAVDTQNVRLNRFGEDANYQNRIMLIYDGIHYDPLMLEPLDPSQPIQTIFSTYDDTILQMGIEVAREAKASRQYTDVRNFSLRCLVCNAGLKGQAQAQQHAKETGHVNFGEV